MSARSSRRRPRYSRNVPVGTEELIEAARKASAAWSGVNVSLDDFVAQLRERLHEDDTPEGLAKLHVADLYLAYACAQGDETAWRELDRHHLSRIGEFVGRIDASPTFADDVRQRLGAKLITGSDGPGKLALYTGRGPLGAWLRVAAIREAQNGKRRGKKTVDADQVALADRADDPELNLLKQRFAKEFSEAFKSVLVTLSADERNVLRLHYLDGLTLEEVGKTYRVSRATAARWISSARETIIERTQAALGARLGANAPNAVSMLDLVKSQLDLSLARHFKP
jgi:RNA polymerase sigma-70 factor (ECF subfamily)